MTTLTATHTPFLQSPAQLLILPMSADAKMSHSTLARIKSLYPGHHEAYLAACRDGVPLGTVLLTRIQKEQFGFGVASNAVPSHIATLIVMHHAQDHIAPSTVKTCLQALKPKLFDLVRHQGVRRAALYAHPLIRMLDDIPTLSLDELWQQLQALDIPKLVLDAHFDRQTPIAHLA